MYGIHTVASIDHPFMHLDRFYISKVPVLLLDNHGSNILLQ